MSGIYFRLRNSLFGGARANLEAEQTGWLRSRQGCGRDGACIADSYRQRIRELAEYWAGRIRGGDALLRRNGDSPWQASCAWHNVY
jgi:hypothetical protein